MGGAAVSANHDKELLLRARSVPLSQGSQDSQRAQVVRGEQAALQGRRPGAVPASDHGPRAGAQKDRRRIHRRSESQWRLYDAYLSLHRSGLRMAVASLLRAPIMPNSP